MSENGNGNGAKPDKLAVARSLAEDHLRVDPSVQSVFLLEPPRKDGPWAPIRLLEVVEGTFEGDVLPVGFPANPKQGRPYPFAVVEISPREYEAIANGRLKIYDDVWTVGEMLVSR